MTAPIWASGRFSAQITSEKAEATARTGTAQDRPSQTA